MSNPGILNWSSWRPWIFAACSLRDSIGKKVAPICWVIPPASPPWTFVWRILSNKLVFPVSTCPIITQIGDLNSPAWTVSCAGVVGAAAIMVGVDGVDVELLFEVSTFPEDVNAGVDGFESFEESFDVVDVVEVTDDVETFNFGSNDNAKKKKQVWERFKY